MYWLASRTRFLRFESRWELQVSEPLPLKNVAIGTLGFSYPLLVKFIFYKTILFLYLFVDHATLIKTSQTSLVEYFSEQRRVTRRTQQLPSIYPLLGKQYLTSKHLGTKLWNTIFSVSCKRILFAIRFKRIACFVKQNCKEDKSPPS